MIVDESSGFRERLEAIRGTFVEELTDKIDSLRSAAARLLDDGDAGETTVALETVYILAHNLAGSAALFGFSAVSAAARRLEEACRLRLSGAETPAERPFAEIRSAVELLERLADERESAR